MRSPRALLAEVQRQGAELVALDRHRLALKGGDTRLRLAVDRHLAELLAVLHQGLVVSLRATEGETSPVSGGTAVPVAPPPPGPPLPVQRPPAPRQRRQASPAPGRSCLDCGYHQPPRCAATGERITRNRAHRCPTFESAAGTRSKA